MELKKCRCECLKEEKCSNDSFLMLLIVNVK